MNELPNVSAMAEIAGKPEFDTRAVITMRSPLLATLISQVPVAVSDPLDAVWLFRVIAPELGNE